MPVISADTLVTDTQLASLAGVSARRIRQLAEDGRLERNGRNEYVLGPAIRRLIEDAAGSGSALQRERTRKLAADATLAELELAKAMQAVAPLDEITRAWSRKMAVIRQLVLTVPARVAMSLVGERSEIKIKQSLTNELTDALRRAAETEATDEESEEDEADPP